MGRVHQCNALAMIIHIHILKVNICTAPLAALLQLHRSSLSTWAIICKWFYELVRKITKVKNQYSNPINTVALLPTYFSLWKQSISICIMCDHASKRIMTLIKIFSFSKKNFHRSIKILFSDRTATFTKRDLFISKKDKQWYCIVQKS